MRPGINSTQKLLTLDFPTSPSLRNFASFTLGASQARPGRILDATGNKGIEACKAKQQRKKVSISCSNSLVYGRGSWQITRKRQDKSSDSRLRRISMTVGLSSLRTLERETGFEPATSTLARLHSTTELLPRSECNFYTIAAQFVNGASRCARHFPYEI